MPKKPPKKPRPRPRPRPGYRLALSWLLLAFLGWSCSGAPAQEPAPAKVDLSPGDIDGDGRPDRVLEADGDHVVWQSGDGPGISYAVRPGSTLDWMTATTPDADFAERTEVDIDADGDLDTWVDDPSTSACIPWGGGCASGTCCAPFSCMWTGVGINRKKKCCGSTSGSPFYNCQ